eukprot:Opistho-2@17820
MFSLSWLTEALDGIASPNVYVRGDRLSQCPSHVAGKNGLGGWMHYPTTSIIFLVASVLCFGFTATTLLRYNTVRVLNKKIRTPNISNNTWILYFFAVAMRCVFECVLYVRDDEDTHANAGILLAAVVLYGVGNLMLALPLDHQRKHRSTVAVTSSKPQPVAQPTEESKEPRRTSSSSVMSFIASTESLFLSLFVFYIVCLFLVLMKNETAVYGWLFFTANVFQRIPVLVLGAIVALRENGADGPSRASRLCIAAGVALNIICDFPPSWWQAVLPDACPLYFASYVDILIAFFLVSLVLFFTFLRAEYLRNMEDCIWTTVSQIQEFNVRQFPSA